ncbi:MAG: SUMF1/EgtB/PvdO family nonheme iron enzyme, partial [Kordiimonadaceae bacterium]|nr:SUMF1/EgtB/PvdO family nonheme iron enzyme [Kordiimonadaceae bacterium]
MNKLLFMLIFINFQAQLAIAETQQIEVKNTLQSFEIINLPDLNIWAMKTEVTWDLYDIFLLRLDLPEAEREKEVDLNVRPSKPYYLPNEGFGHSGQPALAINYNGAVKFATWLSENTGKAFRLPTEDEWEGLCYADIPEKLDEHAWFDENSDLMTGAVGTLKPNEFGLYDTLGNVAEWASGRDGKKVIKGGAFWDVKEDIH